MREVSASLSIAQIVIGVESIKLFMPQMQHGRYALSAWLAEISANCLIFHQFAIGDDLVLYEVAEC